MNQNGIWDVECSTSSGFRCGLLSFILPAKQERAMAIVLLAFRAAQEGDAVAVILCRQSSLLSAQKRRGKQSVLWFACKGGWIVDKVFLSAFEALPLIYIFDNHKRICWQDVFFVHDKLSELSGVRLFVHRFVVNRDFHLMNTPCNPVSVFILSGQECRLWECNCCSNGIVMISTEWCREWIRFWSD